jgi:hypothetical protein
MKSEKNERMGQDKQPKLNYRFHNPNTPEDTADFLIKLYVEYHMDELEAMLLAAQEDTEKGQTRCAVLKSPMSRRKQRIRKARGDKRWK